MTRNKFNLWAILAGIFLVMLCIVPIAGYTAEQAQIDKAVNTVLPGGILFAEPSQYATFYDDFFGYNNAWSADLIGWKNASIAHADTLTVLNTQNGAISIKTAAAENDGANLRYAREIVKPDSTRPLLWETRIKIDEYIQSDIIAGLAISDSTLFGGVTDGIYFIKVDGDSLIKCMTRKDTTNADTTATTIEFVNDTWIRLGISMFNKTITYWINGKAVAKHSTIANIATDEEMTPVFEILAGSAGSKTLYIDYVKTKQKR